MSGTLEEALSAVTGGCLDSEYEQVKNDEYDCAFISVDGKSLGCSR